MCTVANETLFDRVQSFLQPVPLSVCLLQCCLHVCCDLDHRLLLDRKSKVWRALQADKGEVVDQMGQLLEEAGMRDVLPLPKARVPVVKFVVPDTNTKVRLLHGHRCSSMCVRPKETLPWQLAPSGLMVQHAKSGGRPAPMPCPNLTPVTVRSVNTIVQTGGQD